MPGSQFACHRGCFSCAFQSLFRCCAGAKVVVSQALVTFSLVQTSGVANAWLCHGLQCAVFVAASSFCPIKDVLRQQVTRALWWETRASTT